MKRWPSLQFFLVSLFLVVSQVAWSQTRPASRSESRNQKPLVDVDLSGATGNYNGKTYSEIHLGLNLNFTDWLTWRNAGFKRFSAEPNSEVTGLDSTLRIISDSKFDGGGFRLFAGAGYRFANPANKNALLGEAGVGLQIGRFGFGAGAKYLQYDKAQIDAGTGLETKKDDVVYFVTLSGGAGLQF